MQGWGIYILLKGSNFLVHRTRVLGPGHVGYIVVGASLKGMASSIRVGDTVRPITTYMFTLCCRLT